MSSDLTQEHTYKEHFNEEQMDESVDENYVNRNYVKIPDWHMAIIEERMARYESEGTEWTPWEEFEKELFAENEGELKD